MGSERTVKSSLRLGPRWSPTMEVVVLVDHESRNDDRYDVFNFKENCANRVLIAAAILATTIRPAFNQCT